MPPGNYHTLERLARFCQQATTEDDCIEYLLDVSKYQPQDEWDEERNKKYEDFVKFSENEFELNLIRPKDVNCAQLESLTADKKRMLANALDAIFNTSVILAKMDIIERTLVKLDLEPFDYEDIDLVNLPQIFCKISFIVNEERSENLS